MIKTILYDEHLKLGGKMIPFAGFYMPANYSKGIIEEYKTIRNNVGVFDVSHMGQIEVSGVEAEVFLQTATTNNIEKMSIGSAQYNLICNNEGGIIDDIIIYKIDKNIFILIVNASNIDKDYKWLENISDYDVNIKDLSNDFSLIALQGPNSRIAMFDLFNIKLENKFYSFEEHYIFNKRVLISRTGYTGELGFELLSDHRTILKIWKKMIEKNILPCGLAVRDTLRIEMKYCLYGNDINDDINPLEAGLKWVVDLSKRNFIGKNKILEFQLNKPVKKLICFKMLERGIPRTNYEIYINNKNVGYVTSGTFSTNLNIGIGLGYINNFIVFDNEKEKKCEIKIRDKFINAEIIQPPFINKYSLHD